MGDVVTTSDRTAVPEYAQAPDGSELATRLEATFRLLARRLYGAETGVHRSGLDRASSAVLSVLAENDAIRPSDVAIALELDLSTISRRLIQLEDLQLIRKTKDETDGRAYRLSITEHGLADLLETRARRAALLNSIFEQWDDADRERLLALTSRLLAGLGGAPTPGQRREPANTSTTDSIGATL